MKTPILSSATVLVLSLLSFSASAESLFSCNSDNIPMFDLTHGLAQEANEKTALRQALTVANCTEIPVMPTKVVFPKVTKKAVKDRPILGVHFIRIGKKIYKLQEIPISSFKMRTPFKNEDNLTTGNLFFQPK